MTTLKILDNLHGVAWNPGPKEHWSSIDYWYFDILDKQLEALTVGDVSRLIRQGWHVGSVWALAIEYLKSDINIGEISDCELLESMIEFNWIECGDYGFVVQNLKNLIRNAIDDISEPEVLCKAKEFLQKP